jgi:hypothetical protein
LNLLGAGRPSPQQLLGDRIALPLVADQKPAEFFSGCPIKPAE